MVLDTKDTKDDEERSLFVPPRAAKSPSYANRAKSRSTREFRFQ